jgi:hypothetical protein
MYRFPFRVPPYYALIIRSLVTLEGIALSVDSDFKILGAAYPYFARRLMEDPDPQLRQSLREMLFDGDEFRWQRLEALVSSAALQDQLDVEGLLDQVIEFLFSPGGGMLRRQLVDAMVERMDHLAWRMTLRIGRRLPGRMLPPGLRERQQSAEALDARPLLDLELVQQLTAILQDLPDPGRTGSTPHGSGSGQGIGGTGGGALVARRAGDSSVKAQPESWRVGGIPPKRDLYFALGIEKPGAHEEANGGPLSHESNPSSNRQGAGLRPGRRPLVRSHHGGGRRKGGACQWSLPPLHPDRRI